MKVFDPFEVWLEVWEGLQRRYAAREPGVKDAIRYSCSCGGRCHRELPQDGFGGPRPCLRVKV